VNALPARAAETGKAQDNVQRAGSVAGSEWARLRAEAPQAVAMIHRYLRQLGTFLAPASVNAAENALRQFARWLVTEAGVTAIADVRRDDIEDYKVWLAGKHRSADQVISRETHRQRMRTIRSSSSGSSSGTGPTPRPATLSSPGTSPRSPTRCRSSSTTATRPRSWPPPGPAPIRVTGWCSSC
jgi:hypothetical protein